MQNYLLELGTNKEHIVVSESSPVVAIFGRSGCGLNGARSVILREFMKKENLEIRTISGLNLISIIDILGGAAKDNFKVSLEILLSEAYNEIKRLNRNGKMVVLDICEIGKDIGNYIDSNYSIATLDERIHQFINACRKLKCILVITIHNYRVLPYSPNVNIFVGQQGVGVRLSNLLLSTEEQRHMLDVGSACMFYNNEKKFFKFKLTNDWI